jgi:hypothetical protein
MTRVSVVAGVAVLVGGVALTSASRAFDPQASI